MFGVLFVLATMGQIDIPPLPGYLPAAVAPAPQQVAPIVEAVRVPDTTDYVAWAVQDLMLRQPTDRPFMRYLAVPAWGDISWHHVNSYMVNSAISQSSVTVRPEGTAGGWMIVWDLRRLAPKEHDLKRLLAVWDALAHGEPYFHVELPQGKQVACRQYTHLDGKIYTQRRFVPAPHVAEGYGILERETAAFAPLLRADYFLRRVASTVDGGLYYHFIGFISGGKRLTETEIFKLVGLDVALSRGVEGDDRAAVFQSAVTGKPRTVEQVQGAIGKARITYDLFDEDVEAGRHPIYELLDFVKRARGKELIYERQNGTLGYFLADGEGKLVDVAPPNLASDHNTPAPVTKQLFPPLSCIRCHGPHSGVQIVRNDVQTLLSGGSGEVDLFDDLTSKDNRFATVDRLAGLYAAADAFNFDAELSRSRHADAIFRATRGMGVRERENVASKAAAKLSEQFADYWYPRSPTEANVNADRACLELGWRVPPGDGSAFLNQTLRPHRVDFSVQGVPVESADPALAALRRLKTNPDGTLFLQNGKPVSAGLTIRRQDLDRIYPYAAGQMIEARKNPKP
jgi:hypothetical protein